MGEFKQVTLKALGWNFFSRFGNQFIKLVIGIILARLLSPREYGLLGMITVFTGYANIIIDFGFGAALIQKKEVSQTDWSSVFWFNLFLGGLITLLVILIAPLIAGFYEESQLEEFTRVVAFNFLLSAVLIVHQVRLVKAINFKALAKIELTAALLSGITGILFAYLGYGVYSLIFMTLTHKGLMVLLTWSVGKWVPTAEFKWEAIRKIMRFSMNLFGNKSLNYFSDNIDSLLIGKHLGTAQLGVYNKGYTFLMLPVTSISSVINKVMFPSYSKIRGDASRLLEVYLKILKAIIFFTAPLMIGIFVVSDVLIIALLGPKWEAMIPFMMLFSLAGIFASINSTFSSLLLSFGRSDIDLQVNILRKAISVPLMIGGLYWGALGVASGRLLGITLSFIPCLYLFCRTVGLPLPKVLILSLKGMVPALGMAVSVFALKTYGTSGRDLPYLVQLAILALAGILLYLLFQEIQKETTYLELKGMLVKKLKRVS